MPLFSSKRLAYITRFTNFGDDKRLNVNYGFVYNGAEAAPYMQVTAAEKLVIATFPVRSYVCETA
jgi:hypothetical protein